MRPATRFTVFLLVFSAVLLADALTLSPRGRIAPLAVLVPTTALAVLKLVRDLRQRGESEGAPAVLAPPADEGPPNDSAHSSTADAQTADGRRRQVRITLWIAGLTGLVYLVGFLPAAAAFLLFYLRVEAGAGWRRSLLVTAGTVAAMYAAFTLLAGLRFPPGVLL